MPVPVITVEFSAWFVTTGWTEATACFRLSVAGRKKELSAVLPLYRGGEKRLGFLFGVGDCFAQTMAGLFPSPAGQEFRLSVVVPSHLHLLPGRDRKLSAGLTRVCLEMFQTCLRDSREAGEWLGVREEEKP